MAKAVVYVTRPQVAATFDIEVARTGIGYAHVTGADAARLITFVRRSSPVAHFDLEWDGNVFERCELDGAAEGAKVAFKFGAIAPVDPLKNDPEAI